MLGDDDDRETQETVRRMLQEIREGGEEVIFSSIQMYAGCLLSIVTGL